MKEKVTMSAVRGKIRTSAVGTAEPIGQWGGTETFLSIEPLAGPCLVIKSSKHKRGEGIQMPLASLTKVLADFVQDGKATLYLSYGRRNCVVMIQTTDDIDQLKALVSIVKDRSRWNEIEKRVLASEASKKRSRGETAVVESRVNHTRDTRLNADNGVIEEDEDEYDLEPTATDDPAGDGVGDAMGEDEEFARPLTGTGIDKIEPSTYAFSPQQIAALNAVRAGKSVFITGAAGTGKSECLRAILQVLAADKVAVTAATAQAARQLGGITLHSFAGLGVSTQTFEAAMKRVKANPATQRAWRRTSTLIIDEVSMIDATTFDIVDQLARFVRNYGEHAFGGIQMVLVGDFLQLPPVSGSTMAFQATAWRDLDPVVIELTKPWRALDTRFPALLERARTGQLTEADLALLESRIVQDPPADAVHVVARRDAAENINRARLETLSGEHYVYHAADSGETEQYDLDSQTPLLQTLTLKVGARVIAVANDQSQNIRNGDIGVVVSFAEVSVGVHRHLPMVQWEHDSVGVANMALGNSTAEIAFNGRIKAQRTQLPIRLAWALTVHRVQGLSLERVAVHLDRSIFECGQAYVAISRAKSFDGLFLLGGPITRDIFQVSAAATAFYAKVAQS
jgi:ATP-dependent DNA helicase PIF1